MADTADCWTTDCCIVGAGPAGLMLALLLARQGVRVIVVEAHRDFDRDFRGDTVHASTLNVLDQLGLADALLEIPHSKLRHIRLHTPEATISAANFSYVPGRFPFVAVMPQADFLQFVHERSQLYDGYQCLTATPCTDLFEEDGRVAGILAQHDGRPVTIRAQLVVAADGRFSRLRKRASLAAVQRAPPMDVCWFRVPRASGDIVDEGGFYLGGGRMLVCLPRSDRWQIGYVFPKGDYKAIRQNGIDAFRNGLATTAPWLGDRVATLEFADLHLLRVESDCLERWHKPGLMLIGDAAHVMSPVGGVGINAAIADAVSLSNHAGAKLRAGKAVQPETLAAVQKERERITWIIQSAQRLIQSNLITRALADQPFRLPLAARMALRIPVLRSLPARLFALGVRQPVVRN